MVRHIWFSVAQRAETLAKTFVFSGTTMYGKE